MGVWIPQRSGGVRGARLHSMAGANAGFVRACWTYRSGDWFPHLVVLPSNLSIGAVLSQLLARLQLWPGSIHPVILELL